MCSPCLHLLSRLPALGYIYICPFRLQLLPLQILAVVFFLIWIWDLAYDDSRTSENLLNLEVIQPLMTALITQTGRKAVFPTNFTAEVITAKFFLGVLLPSDKHKKISDTDLGTWQITKSLKIHHEKKRPHRFNCWTGRPPNHMARGLCVLDAATAKRSESIRKVGLQKDEWKILKMAI